MDWMLILAAATFATAILSTKYAYKGMKAAEEGTMLARQTFKESKLPRLHLQYIADYAAFVLTNVGTDRAKGMVDESQLFRLQSTELLPSAIPATYSPTHPTNASIMNRIGLKNQIDGDAVAIFSYENSLGEKFTSKFSIERLKESLIPQYEVKEIAYAATKQLA